MNSLNRIKIISNMNFLASNTSNLPVLQNLLQEKSILSMVEVQTINSEPIEYEKNSSLYRTIIKKGDEAFDILIECLNKSGNKAISNKLVAQATPATDETDFVQPNYPNSMHKFDLPHTSTVSTLLEPNPVSTVTANQTRLANVAQQDNQQDNEFQSQFPSRYRDNNVKYVGKGGWGVVYKGIPRNSERTVAVKLIENTGKHVSREITVALKIHHFENLVQVLDHWFEKPPVGHEYPLTTPIGSEVKDVLFIEMEYCDLGNLKSWLGKRVWDKTHAKIILYQITKGLAYLHNKNIVHRDLNPDNIMMCSDGLYAVAKICDFGIAKQIATKNTTAVGTYGYIAPEVKISGGDYSCKADVYALAITFFDMLVPSHTDDGELDPKIVQAKYNPNGLEFIEYVKTVKSQANFEFKEKDIIEKMAHKDIKIRLSSKELMEKILPETYEGIADMKIPNPNRN